MAKLTRVTQPIFASDAAVNETSVFGTMKTSAQYTANIADSINTVAFTKGWSDAVELDYAPYMEDMNTVQRAITYQIAYNQQEGIPEWASDTTYYKGSWAKYNATNGAQIYESLVDNNTGNLVSDTTKWKLVYDTTNSAITSIVGANLTASRALVSNSSGKVAVSAVTGTELGYVSGVTSAIQTQINGTVKTSGNQTIGGTKTFSSTIAGSINGNAATVTNGVYTTGNQTIGGTKTFSAVAYGKASDANTSILTTVAKSKASNGYFKLGNGLIIQWGRVTGITSNQESTVTFPVAFSSSTSYTIVKNYQSNATTSAADREISFYSMTSTTAKTFTASDDTSSFSWLAIGY